MTRKRKHIIHIRDHPGPALGRLVIGVRLTSAWGAVFAGALICWVTYQFDWLGAPDWDDKIEILLVAGLGLWMAGWGIRHIFNRRPDFVFTDHGLIACGTPDRLVPWKYVIAIQLIARKEGSPPNAIRLPLRHAAAINDSKVDTDIEPREWPDWHDIGLGYRLNHSKARVLAYLVRATGKHPVDIVEKQS